MTEVTVVIGAGQIVQAVGRVSAGKLVLPADLHFLMGGGVAASYFFGNRAPA